MGAVTSESDARISTLIVTLNVLFHSEVRGC